MNPVRAQKTLKDCVTYELSTDFQSFNGNGKESGF